jgi:hypothetical protein
MNINYESINIPKTIITAQSHVTTSLSLEPYLNSIYHLNAIYFYAQLFKNINVEQSYDSWNWLSLIYDEITMLCLYGNTLNTIIKDKIIYSENTLTVKLLP